MFVGKKSVINRERLEHAINLPTFCHKLPDHELSKLEETRNYLVKKMRHRERLDARSRALTPRAETETDIVKTKSSESDSSIKTRGSTSQKSDNREATLVDSHSGKMRCGAFTLPHLTRQEQRPVHKY